MVGLGHKARFALLGALALAATTSAMAKEATVIVHADKPGPKVQRQIFGQFAEHLGTGVYGGLWVGPKSPIPNTNGFRNDVIGALRAIKVPLIRWPGGCFADEYHWREGVGAPAKRPTSTASMNASCLARLRQTSRTASAPRARRSHCRRRARPVPPRSNSASRRSGAARRALPCASGLTPR